MRKFRAVALATAIVLVASACGGGDTDEAEAEPTPDDTAEEPEGEEEPDDGDAGAGDEEYSIAFIQGVAGDEFYISMECGILEEAEKFGATVNTQGPEQFDATLQTPIVDSVVATSPDAILIAPTDVDALERPIQAAADAGIEIILVDTTLNNADMAASQIASDNLGGGAAAFEALQQLIPDGGKVLVINVQPGVSTTDLRQQGFEEAVATDDSFEYLGTEFSQNEPARAAEIINATLQAHPDLAGVFATNLFSAEGAATGLRQSGRDDVFIVGFDAGPAQVEALRDGTVQALIAQKPLEIGAEGVRQAIAALRGEATTPVVQTDFVIVTTDNIDEPDVNRFLYKAACS